MLTATGDPHEPDRSCPYTPAAPLRPDRSGVARHKETLRDGHGLAWLGGFSLDIKLGARMLRKYPGLTIVGGLAMAFAIAIGAASFEFATQFLYPSLPLPE